MSKALWQLLLEDPSDLTCDECFAVMEYYADVLVGRGDLPSKVIEHLERCPDCALRYRQVLRRLITEPPERGAGPSAGTTGNEGSKTEDRPQPRQDRAQSSGGKLSGSQSV
jgi:hypothetical protein